MEGSRSLILSVTISVENAIIYVVTGVIPVVSLLRLLMHVVGSVRMKAR
jgi:hypothetical protein